MKKVNWICYLIFILGSMYMGPSSATLLSFSPSTNTVNVGDTFDVDVVISDLYAANGPREIVSAFDLDVLYDSAVLDATSVTFGAFLDPLGIGLSFQDIDLSVPGVIDIAELSLYFDFELEALQPDSFTLATLSFDAIGAGASSLLFDQNSLPLPGFFDVKGYGGLLLDVSAEQGSVTVVSSTVPEPGILLLMLSGLLSLGIAGRIKTIMK